MLQKRGLEDPGVSYEPLTDPYFRIYLLLVYNQFVTILGHVEADYGIHSIV